MRLDAEDITPEEIEKLRQRVQSNTKKAAYETGVLYRLVVVEVEVGDALPVPESRVNLTI